MDGEGRDELRPLLAGSEKQLGSFRRQAIALEIKGSALARGTFVLKSDHVVLLKGREDELLADMKTQLVKGHVEMMSQSAEAVGFAVTGLTADIARAEGDGQHFLNSLAEALNEIWSLRYKYEDEEDWEHEEEQDHGDDLSI